MTRDEFELYQTFLQTGFRDQEVGFLERADFNARRGLLSVRKKAGLQFDPKSYAERTIPIPPMLAQLLQRRIARMEDRERLIFGTSTKNIGRGQLGGQRDGHMLRKLKRIALRAGMNCGRCQAMYLKQPASCADAPICEQWTLHKFRHTYATMQLQGSPERPGVDVRTLQKLLGHAKLETTMKYLHMLPEAALAEKIATSTLATMFSCAEGERKS
jgi:integrase